MEIKKRLMLLTGAVTGFANGLFGSGGGIIAVPMLKKSGFETKKAHACSLAVTLPLSAVSAIFYAADNTIEWKYAISLVPFGIAGALFGVYTMKKIPSVWLSRIFGLLLIAAGARSFFQ